METIPGYRCACGREDFSQHRIEECERAHRPRTALIPGVRCLVRLAKEGWGGRDMIVLFMVIQSDGHRRYLVERIQGDQKAGFMDIGERRWVQYTDIIPGCTFCASLLVSHGKCCHCERVVES